MTLLRTLSTTPSSTPSTTRERLLANVQNATLPPNLSPLEALKQTEAFLANNPHARTIPPNMLNALKASAASASQKLPPQDTPAFVSTLARVALRGSMRADVTSELLSLASLSPPPTTTTAAATATTTAPSSSEDVAVAHALAQLRPSSLDWQSYVHAVASNAVLDRLTPGKVGKLIEAEALTARGFSPALVSKTVLFAQDKLAAATPHQIASLAKSASHAGLKNTALFTALAAAANAKVRDASANELADVCKAFADVGMLDLVMSAVVGEVLARSSSAGGEVTAPLKDFPTSAIVRMLFAVTKQRDHAALSGSSLLPAASASSPESSSNATSLPKLKDELLRVAVAALSSPTRSIRNPVDVTRTLWVLEHTRTLAPELVRKLTREIAERPALSDMLTSQLASALHSVAMLSPRPMLRMPMGCVAELTRSLQERFVGGSEEPLQAGHAPAPMLVRTTAWSLACLDTLEFSWSRSFFESVPGESLFASLESDAARRPSTAAEFAKAWVDGGNTDMEPVLRLWLHVAEAWAQAYPDNVKAGQWPRLLCDVFGGDAATVNEARVAACARLGEHAGAQRSVVRRVQQALERSNKRLNVVVPLSAVVGPVASPSGVSADVWLLPPSRRADVQPLDDSGEETRLLSHASLGATAILVEQSSKLFRARFSATGVRMHDDETGMPMGDLAFTRRLLSRVAKRLVCLPEHEWWRLVRVESEPGQALWQYCLPDGPGAQAQAQAGRVRIVRAPRPPL